MSPSRSRASRSGTLRCRDYSGLTQESRPIPLVATVAILDVSHGRGLQGSCQGTSCHQSPSGPPKAPMSCKATPKWARRHGERTTPLDSHAEAGLGTRREEEGGAPAPPGHLSLVLGLQCPSLVWRRTRIVVQEAESPRWSVRTDQDRGSGVGEPEMVRPDGPGSWFRSRRARDGPSSQIRSCSWSSTHRRSFSTAVGEGGGAPMPACQPGVPSTGPTRVRLGGSRGNRMVKRAPPPGRSPTSTSPPWACTMRRLRARPRPVPPLRRV